MNSGSYAEGDLDQCYGREGQDCCSTREEVPCMDWWLHPGLPLHLPADVDL